MVDLQQLIESEGKRYNHLARVLNEEDYLPGEAEVRELGTEHLFTASRKSLEFRYGMQLELLSSTHHLIRLMELYIEQNDLLRESESYETIRGTLANFRLQREELTQCLKEKLLAGYDAGW